MRYHTRKLVMPSDLNPSMSLFGGRLMAWIDEEAAIFARCQLGKGTKIVTKYISALEFKSRSFVDEIVEIGVEVVKFGTTSITLRCVARNKDTKQDIVTVDQIVFVCIDDEGRAKPHGRTEVRAEDDE